MYRESFFLEKPLGNNKISFAARTHKCLYVPSLVKGNGDTIEMGEHIVFEDFDFEGVLQSCRGLKNFYTLPWKGKEITLFDNHNHAYYFWWEGAMKRHFGEGHGNQKFTLIHIDEHSDMRDPGVYLKESELYDLGNIYAYTNQVLNVGNYIVPAVKDGLIDENIIQIRDSYSLDAYFDIDLEGKNIILNLDLDFFEPELDFIDYAAKKAVILDAAQRASIITVATSPFFIDQERAIEVFKDIFSTSG